MFGHPFCLIAFGSLDGASSPTKDHTIDVLAKLWTATTNHFMVEPEKPATFQATAKFLENFDMADIVSQTDTNKAAKSDEELVELRKVFVILDRGTNVVGAVLFRLPLTAKGVMFRGWDDAWLDPSNEAYSELCAFALESTVDLAQKYAAHIDEGVPVKLNVKCHRNNDVLVSLLKAKNCVCWKSDSWMRKSLNATDVTLKDDLVSRFGTLGYAIRPFDSEHHTFLLYKSFLLGFAGSADPSGQQSYEDWSNLILKDDPEFIFVLWHVQTDSIAGAILCAPDDTNKAVWLKSVWMQEEHRSKGLAGILIRFTFAVLAAATTSMGSQRFAKVILDVEESNAREHANALYEKAGMVREFGFNQFHLKVQ